MGGKNLLMKHLTSPQIRMVGACLAMMAMFGVLHLQAITTQTQQQAMSPDEVLEDLIAGNERFVNGVTTRRDFLAEARQSATEGQFPKAIILSCVDSRVPVEIVFDQGIGDLFVGRVAGNVEDIQMLGSMEFATALAGSKLVMVLGHESCGAIKGAIDQAKLGNLTELLRDIEPAVQDAGDVEGKHTSKNPALVEAATLANVRRTVEDLRSRSDVLADLEAKGKIRIVGAYYTLHDGRVRLVE